MSGHLTDSGVWVILPAAGIGTRMQSEIPKQYLTIRSKTILEHTISRFVDFDAIAGILVVLSQEDLYWEAVSARLSSSGVETPFLHTTKGGSERADTVCKGLKYLTDELGLGNEQWVMVHDAARPCLREKDLMNLLGVRESDYSGAILASPVKDTMKRANSNNELISHTESRERLWHALTPQLFRLGELQAAFALAQQDEVLLTDEASAMEYIGAEVMLIEGASDNIKLTTPSDLPLIEFLLQQRDIKTNV